jgi:heat shock protein HtpX
MYVLKIFMLVIIPLAILGGAGFVIGAEEGLFFGILLSSIFVFGIYFWCDRMVLKMCKAEKLTIYHAPTLFRTVKELSDKVGVSVTDIYMIDEQAPNALAVGRRPGVGGLVFTDGLLKALTQEELRHVIVHQLFHIRNYNAVLGCIAAALSSLFGLASRSAQREATIESHKLSVVKKVGRLAFSGMKAVLAPVAALIVQSLVDIKRIFFADEQGALISGNCLAMANAVRTMEKKKHVTPMTVVPAAAHLFTVSPLTTGRIARLLMTHPPMEQRIGRLEEMHRRLNSSGKTALSTTR